jgi:hypothetical protein
MPAPRAPAASRGKCKCWPSCPRWACAHAHKWGAARGRAGHFETIFKAGCFPKSIHAYKEITFFEIFDDKGPASSADESLLELASKPPIDFKALGQTHLHHNCDDNDITYVTVRGGDVMMPWAAGSLKEVTAK